MFHQSDQNSIPQTYISLSSTKSAYFYIGFSNSSMEQTFKLFIMWVTLYLQNGQISFGTTAIIKQLKQRLCLQFISTSEFWS